MLSESEECWRSAMLEETALQTRSSAVTASRIATNEYMASSRRSMALTTFKRMATSYCPTPDGAVYATTGGRWVTVHAAATD
jgi:hypothetical protein